MKNLRTAALWVLSSFWMGSVGALSLGNISLLSKPGERLLAELEVKDISPVESNDLQAFLAAPELYSVARVTPSPELALVKTQFKRKPDGTAVIEFSSERPLTSSSLDMLIEFRWATGRRVFMGNIPTQSAVSAAATATTPPPAPSLPVISPPAAAQPEPAPAIASAPTAPVPTVPAPAAAEKAAEPAPPASPATKSDKSERTLTVVRGDTAGELAARHKSSQVSLDQMLLALLRANPDAFVNNNVNRLKAGAVLKLPTEPEAQQTTTAEARQTIQAQALDFAKYRANLASAAPSTELPKASRSVEGRVQGVAKDGTAQPNQDKLTLSKANSAAAKEADQVATQKQVEQDTKDTQNASQTVADLNVLAQAASGMAAPGVQVSAPPEKAAGSVIDDLIAHPWTPYAAGTLVALLALLGWARSRQRAHQDAAENEYASTRPPEASPPSPFNFDLELEPQAKDAPPQVRSAAPPLDASQPDFSDAPPPSDYEVRLNLAEELWDMGQQNTARALADEVVREATGEIQLKAQRWLSQRQA